LIPPDLNPRASFLQRMERLAEILCRSFAPGIALAFLSLATLKAFFDFDNNFDSIAYHLPFAALRVGIVERSQFQLTGMLQNYYDGFPTLAYYLKGWLWLLFAKPEAVNLVSIGSFCCLVAYTCRAFKLQYTWAVIGLASIPVVLVSVARNQLDLPANSFMAIVALSVCDWYLHPDAFGKRKLCVALVAGCLAAHFKPQMVVHVAVTGFLVAFLIAISLRKRSELTAGIRARPLQSAAIFAVSTLLIFYEALHNWVKNRNPFYPMELKFGRLTIFPGPLTPWGLWPQPMYSAHYFQPLRWILSVLEFRAFDFRPVPYTVGNGDVPVEGMSAHAGGYMGLAVLFSLGLFIYLVWRRRARSGRVFGVALVIITLVSASPPGSQEIRYAVYWMMFLVLTNLIMLMEGGSELSPFGHMYKLFLLCDLLWVCLITGGGPIIPEFRGLAAYERTSHLNEQLSNFVHGGETICLKTNYQFAFLYAPPFHPVLAAQRPYSVRVEHFTLGEKDFISPGSAVCTWLP
jgi:hypothetical protein